MMDIYEHTETQLVFLVKSAAAGSSVFSKRAARPFDEDYSRTGRLSRRLVCPNFGAAESVALSFVKRKAGRARGSTEMASSDAEIGASKASAHLNLGYEETSRLVHICVGVVLK